MKATQTTTLSKTEIIVTSFLRLTLFVIVLSVIVNLVSNSYVCYMRLFHFKEARRCAEYIKFLVPDYSKSFLFLGQIAFYDKNAKISDIETALE